MLVSPREAARLMSVSERTLFTWSRNGLIPAVRVGRIVRYDRADIASWVRQHKEIPAEKEKSHGKPVA